MTTNLVAEIRQYASKHYEASGWDILVESWSDESILAALQGETDLGKAIVILGKQLDDLDDYRMDIQATAF